MTEQQQPAGCDPLQRMGCGDPRAPGQSTLPRGARGPEILLQPASSPPAPQPPSPCGAELGSEPPPQDLLEIGGEAAVAVAAMESPGPGRGGTGQGAAAARAGQAAAAAGPAAELPGPLLGRCPQLPHWAIQTPRDPGSPPRLAPKARRGVTRARPLWASRGVSLWERRATREGGGRAGPRLR